MTVGRATTTAATGTNSTNIVSGTSPLVLPITTGTMYYMAANSGSNGDNTSYINLNGFALDAPGAGTYYYTIWMSSDVSQAYTSMSAILSVLKVQ